MFLVLYCMMLFSYYMCVICRSNQKEQLLIAINTLTQVEATALYRVKMYLLLLCYYEYFNRNTACQCVLELLQVCVCLCIGMCVITVG